MKSLRHLKRKELRRNQGDVYQVVTKAPQDSVVIPVTILQQILMDAKEISVPVCMQTAYSAQEANTMIKDLIAQPETHYENYITEMEAVKSVRRCAYHNEMLSNLLLSMHWMKGK